MTLTTTYAMKSMKLGFLALLGHGLEVISSQKH